MMKADAEIGRGTNTRSMKTTALAGWYGANRMLAPTVGRELSGCSFVAVPFAGGMSELAHIEARTILVNDLHPHMINLARVVGDRVLGPQLYRRLRRQIFHPDTLKQAQDFCREMESQNKRAGGLFDFPMQPQNNFQSQERQLEWAEAYFICCWMGRGGNAGTANEFEGGLSFRCDAGGGDSNTRFRSATSSLIEWRHRVLWRCTFVCEDALKLLDRIADREGNGAYIDCPWPDAGDSYKHQFTTFMQRELARKLAAYQKTRVVIRFGVHRLIEELYPRDRWNWVEQTSRAQSNGDVKEALILNGPSLAREAA